MIASVLFVACGPTADPKAVSAVQISAAGAPPAECRLLAALEGKDADRWVPGGPYYEKAVLDLRRQAVLGGGNYLFIDSSSGPRDTDYMPAWVVKARLFSCPVAMGLQASGPALMPVGPQAAPSPGPGVTMGSQAAPNPLICEPDCSPGYTCLRGKCVSACNPLCGAGERCGADRICHAISPPPPAVPAPPPPH
ncbi:Hypothetical protein A7982_03336 [Minicystis rosea]|nr:Hypothetical protein A7982_03336 [Minicystis rosea]